MNREHGEVDLRCIPNRGGTQDVNLLRGNVVQHHVKLDFLALPILGFGRKQRNLKSVVRTRIVVLLLLVGSRSDIAPESAGLGKLDLRVKPSSASPFAKVSCYFFFPGFLYGFFDGGWCPNLESLQKF